MKLSEIAQNDYVKLLVYGASGAGKTCLAAGFPGPIKYFDFDNKISSAAKFYATDKAKLEQIDVIQYAQMPRETRMKSFQAELSSIFSLANQGKPLPYKTYVLDSLTTFVSYLLDDYIHVSQRGIKRPLDGVNAMQDYQLLDKHLTQIISGLLSLQANVVFVGHMGVEKDEMTGSILRRPLMSGKFADKLPMWFEEVYIARVTPEGKFILQTKPDHTYAIARTQRNLNKEIPASFEAILNK